MWKRHVCGRGYAARIARSVLAKMGDVKRIMVRGPDGAKTVNVGTNEDVVLPPMERVGIYTTEPAVPGLAEMAVNLVDGNESDLKPVTLSSGINSASASAQNEHSQSDLWRWLIAFAVLPLLMIEWWVYARRVHM